jgi:predicted MFS family arabinose efflux permease
MVNAAVLLAIRIPGRKLPDQLGPRRAATIGLTLAVVGSTIPALFAQPAGLYVGAAFFGAGHALLYPALFMMAVGAAASGETSGAVGTLKACEAGGFALGAATLGLVAATSGYQAVYALAAVLMGAAFLPLLLRRHRDVPTRVI